MNCCENGCCCDRRTRNVSVRVYLGPVVAVLTTVLLAVLLMHLNAAPSPAQASKPVKAATHRKITVIPVGEAAPEKTPEPASSPLPIKVEAEGADEQ